MLVAVGIGGIIIAACTLKKIERQTAATEKTVKPMVGAERAWMLVEKIIPIDFVPLTLSALGLAEPTGKHLAFCHFKNSGHTQAKIMGLRLELQYGDNIAKPPDETIFTGEPGVFLSQAVVAPGELLVRPARKQGLSAIFSDQEITEMKETCGFLWVCGYVLYGDVFTDEIHRTNICLVYLHTPYFTTEGFHASGPEEYNSAD